MIEKETIKRKLKVTDDETATEWQWRIEELAIAAFEFYKGLLAKKTNSLSKGEKG